MGGTLSPGTAALFLALRAKRGNISGREDMIFFAALRMTGHRMRSSRGYDPRCDKIDCFSKWDKQVVSLMCLTSIRARPVTEGGL